MSLSDANAVFYRVRGRLEAIAYSMLGSMADAEDVVQDVWLKWHHTDQSAVNNVEAWLVTVTTRVSIDHFRASKARREHYAGYWLPEPVLTEDPTTPEEIQERHGEVSFALLSVLERLSAEARAAFLLREIFDFSYVEIAESIGKSEASVRQIVHRAKSQLRGGPPRYAVSPELHGRIVERFAEAMSLGQFQAIKSILSENVELIGDGGPKQINFATPLAGEQRIAQFFYAFNLRYKGAVRLKLASVNGEVSLLRYIDEGLESVQTVETDGEHIICIRIQRDPEKLIRIASELGVPLFLPP